MNARKPKLLDAQALLDYAVRCVGARAQTYAELRAKLLRRALEPALVAGTLDRLTEWGYLNDQRFAEGFATARLANEGHGKMRVLRDLRQRRVSPAIAGKAVEETFRETDEPALIEAFLQRKYRGKKLDALLSEDKHLAGAYRRLRYAGFSSHNSILVLKKFTAKAEALEAMEPADPPEAEEQE